MNPPEKMFSTTLKALRDVQITLQFLTPEEIEYILSKFDKTSNSPIADTITINILNTNEGLLILTSNFGELLPRSQRGIR